MAFVAPSTLPLRSASRRPVDARRALQPTAGLRAFRPFTPPSPGDSDGSEGDPPRFAPFDGSRPLLPPFRPATPEAEITFHVSRVQKREKAGEAAKAANRVIAVPSATKGTLFAEVVQDDLPHGKVWLRPLMLLGEVDEWCDLRQTSDCFLPSTFLGDSIPSETRTTLQLNMIAAESDLMDRLVNDEREGDNEAHRKILSDFLQSLNDVE